jgi:ubiquinone biosynthesis protein Coq4
MDRVDTTEQGDAAPAEDTKARKRMSAAEEAYMRGSVKLNPPSVMITTSKYLNDPYYRETFAQAALRGPGHDVSPTYLIPNMSRALSETRDEEEYARLIEEEKAKYPAFKAWLERRRLTDYKPDELRQYKDGTLGATIRSFIEDSGMQIDFRGTGLSPKTDGEYILRRRAKHHDIEHMVTGFGPNAYGEFGMSMMNIISIYTHFTPKLAMHLCEAMMFGHATGMFRTHLHAPEYFLGLQDALHLGREAGRSIKMPLLLVDWEDYLHMTPEDIAADLGFTRGPGAAWDFSSKMFGDGGY